MTEKKRILIVTQEMEPYTEMSIIAQIARKLPQFVQEKGMEIRVLMPRFGTINERRHRLHEVVRLSGMNIIVDDDDYPLIIKVASLPGARMQVYFLDNDEFFKRKQVFHGKDEEPFKDNAERMIFFCKGVIETVRKFGWPPDIIHCHGWMTSLIPLYIREAYKNEPLFENSKIIYSAYDKSLESTFPENFVEKAAINNLEAENLASYHTGANITLDNGAIVNSDAVILGSESPAETVTKALAENEKPTLDFQPIEDGFLNSYIEFYNSLLETEAEVE